MRHLCAQLPRPRHRVLYLCDSTLKPAGIYRALAGELGLRPNHRRGQLWTDLKRTLVHLVDEQHVQPVLVLYEAHLLSDDFLQELAAFLKLKPRHFSRDPKVVADVRGADPLVDPRKVPASTAAGLIGAIEHIQADMEKLAVPVLILHGEQDRITPPDGSRALYRRASVVDKQLTIVPGAYHDLLHEPGHDAILTAIQGFVRGHLKAPAAAPVVGAPPGP